MPLTQRTLFWLSILSMSIAIAGDAPPATLPKGFLEQLPLLERLSDREFDALARFAASQPAPAPHTNRKQAGRQDDED